MKKILITLLFTCLLVTCSSCVLFKDKKEQCTDGIFKYELVYSRIVECYVMGLTEYGQKQSYLIFPEFYNEHKVLNVGYDDSEGLWAQRLVGEFKSSELKRLYFNFGFEPNYASIQFATYDIYLPNCYVVLWVSSSRDDLFSNHKGYIFGYNAYKNNNYVLSTKEYISKIGNVSYMYNYEECPNDGYYWVDNYTNSVIEFIPPVPIREGYEFKGWYKESECINIWDFDNDILGDDIIIDSYDSITEYTGTYLYAKWEAI